jgi:uncharacterized membrane protein HdeD (DUF308 family)
MVKKQERKFNTLVIYVTIIILTISGLGKILAIEAATDRLLTPNRKLTVVLGIIELLLAFILITNVLPGRSISKSKQNESLENPWNGNWEIE